jgi:predicted kinase
MNETSSSEKPFLIVVTGRPGAGKTSLAHALAREIGCPAICRDEIKEGLVNTTGHKGAPGGEADRHVYETFFDTVELLVTRKVTLVAEAAFQHKLWAPQLGRFRDIADVRIVVCEVEPETAQTRRTARAVSEPSRERFHHDRAALEKGDTAYDPPRLDVPILTVNTSDGYEPGIEAVVAFATAGKAK